LQHRVGSGRLDQHVAAVPGARLNEAEAALAIGVRAQPGGGGEAGAVLDADRRIAAGSGAAGIGYVAPRRREGAKAVGVDADIAAA
jgi:hypothetical protein